MEDYPFYLGPGARKAPLCQKVGGHSCGEGCAPFLSLQLGGWTMGPLWLDLGAKWPSQ